MHKTVMNAAETQHLARLYGPKLTALEALKKSQPY